MLKPISDRRFVLRYGGKIVGRFSTSEAALDEVERLSRLDMKHGWLPKAFEVSEDR